MLQWATECGEAIGLDDGERAEAEDNLLGGRLTGVGRKTAEDRGLRGVWWERLRMYSI
jgi:hypothetical protein